MIDTEQLASIARQMMKSATVEVNGERLTVRRTSAHRLRTIAFKLSGREYQAIEQNAEKPSRWGELARAGHEVVQFKDVQSNKFVAVAVDGKVKVTENGAQGKTRKPDLSSAAMEHGRLRMRPSCDYCCGERVRCRLRAADLKPWGATRNIPW